MIQRDKPLNSKGLCHSDFKGIRLAVPLAGEAISMKDSFWAAAIFGLLVFGVPNLSAQVHDRDSNPYWDDPRDRDDDERNSPSATELVALTEKWNFVER